MKHCKNFNLRFKIGSSTHYLPFLRRLLPAVSRCGVRLPRRAERVCALAMIEAVDNAIFHAHKSHAEKPIGIGISVKGGKIVIKITDCGCGFDMKKISVPSLYQTHGRGIFIMKGLMSSVRYENNTLRMIYDK